MPSYNKHVIVDNSTTVVGGEGASICSVISGIQTFTKVTILFYFRSPLVPVFSFGENDIFRQVSNPRGSRLREIQVKIQKTVAFAPVLFYGRGIFQYSFGLLPHRKPIHTVGKLIHS